MQLSLAHLTAISLAPADLVRVAARVGFKSVGLRLLKVTPESPGYPLMNDPLMLRETKAALSDTGIGVSDIEFVMITPTLDVGGLRSFLEAGSALGASNVIVAPYDPDRERLADRYAALCELASDYSMRVMMEFFPWAEIKNLADAHAFVNGVDQPNSGILVDTLHFARSGGTFEELMMLNPAKMPFVHISDAPAAHPQTLEGLLFQAREERLPPGQGGLDLKGFLKHLPPQVMLALEVPMAAYTKRQGLEASIQCVYDAMTKMISEIRQS
ncbi:sugar phosphate isomerase/epimerase [Sinorhizobium sp. 8-89]|uniref:sugar phosphate isomerase/epimerase family protein n=1 Tax=Sinorhizobium sp. 7-81 TaxID=3049087 RepID=UPI0024C380FB|nr:sugar phosphate isomerase/epimerase [Sinorhizobium sp. 7-81]MDK1389392.1 sugar phosphate isomerase/epimerase [Sinorhizobium sp. 7-81]